MLLGTRGKLVPIRQLDLEDVLSPHRLTFPLMKRSGAQRTDGECFPHDSPPVIGSPPQSSTVQSSYRHKIIVGVHPHLRVIVCDLHEAIISSESVSHRFWGTEVCLLYSPSMLGHVSLGGLGVPHIPVRERRPSIATNSSHHGHQDISLDPLPNQFYSPRRPENSMHGYLLRLVDPSEFVCSLCLSTPGTSEALLTVLTAVGFTRGPWSEQRIVLHGWEGLELQSGCCRLLYPRSPGSRTPKDMWRPDAPGTEPEHVWHET